MPLPEIPDSWFKFLTALAAFIAAVAASIGAFLSHNNGTDIKVVHDNQQVNTQKIDATAAKVVAVEQKQDALHVVAEKTAEKVGAKK